MSRRCVFLYFGNLSFSYPAVPSGECKFMHTVEAYWQRGDDQLQLHKDYRQISNITRTKSQTLNVSCLVLHLSFSNPLKPGIKSRMEM